MRVSDTGVAVGAGEGGGAEWRWRAYAVEGGGRRAEGGGRRGEGLAEGKGEVGVRDLPLRLFTQGNCDPEGEARAAPTAAASDKAPSPSGKTRLLASACARGLEAARKRALSLPRERCSHPLEQRPIPLCLRRKEVAKVVRRDELEPGHTHRSEVSRLHRPARDGGLLRLCCRYRYYCCCHCCYTTSCCHYCCCYYWPSPVGGGEGSQRAHRHEELPAVVDRLLQREAVRVAERLRRREGLGGRLRREDSPVVRVAKREALARPQPTGGGQRGPPFLPPQEGAPATAPPPPHEHVRVRRRAEKDASCSGARGGGARVGEASRMSRGAEADGAPGSRREDTLASSAAARSSLEKE